MSFRKKKEETYNVILGELVILIKLILSSTYIGGHRGRKTPTQTKKTRQGEHTTTLRTFPNSEKQPSPPDPDHLVTTPITRTGPPSLPPRRHRSRLGRTGREMNTRDPERRGGRRNGDLGPLGPPRESYPDQKEVPGVQRGPVGGDSGNRDSRSRTPRPRPERSNSPFFGM